MTTRKPHLAGILGMAAMFDALGTMPLAPSRPTVSARMQLTGVKGGHISWGNPHDASVKKRRAKERRAKQARKINWG